MKILTRKYFNLSPNPWDVRANDYSPLLTADMRRVSDMVEAAVATQAFVSILGNRGSGKSYAIRTALAQYENVAVVEPLRLDRDRLTMNDIASAIVRDLSDQTPKHGGEARAYQVKRLLGETTAPVVLVIDDAHALHGQTLRALKRLLEMSWHGRSPLLGIILIGQQDKTTNIPEVGLRSDQLWLGGLTIKESETALAKLKPTPFKSGAVEAIAAAPAARNWLDLQALVDACLLVAQADGQRSVATRHVALALDPSSGTVYGQDVLYAGFAGAKTGSTMPTNAPSDAQIGDYLADKMAGKTTQRKVANG